MLPWRCPVSRGGVSPSQALAWNRRTWRLASIPTAGRTIGLIRDAAPIPPVTAPTPPGTPNPFATPPTISPAGHRTRKTPTRGDQPRGPAAIWRSSSRWTRSWDSFADHRDVRAVLGDVLAGIVGCRGGCGPFIGCPSRSGGWIGPVTAPGSPKRLIASWVRGNPQPAHTEHDPPDGMSHHDHSYSSVGESVPADRCSLRVYVRALPSPVRPSGRPPTSAGPRLTPRPGNVTGNRSTRSVNST